MARPEAFEQERLELERLLKSPVFARSPDLTAILRYFCEEFFAGELDDLREYQIATEALGRPSRTTGRTSSLCTSATTVSLLFWSGQTAGAGKISLEFIPGAANYPLINAIEVEDDS
jgi:hypothetical protein